METATQKAREYETIYILQPDVDTDTAERVANRTSEVVERLAGKLRKVDNWGRRRMAYPIGRHAKGVYVYVRYVGGIGLVAEIERNLKMFDQVIRIQTTRIGDEVDLASIVVDPEEVKFRPLEVTDEEPDVPPEVALGLVDLDRRPRERATEDEFGDDDGTPEAEVSAPAKEA